MPTPDVDLSPDALSGAPRSDRAHAAPCNAHRHRAVLADPRPAVQRRWRVALYSHDAMGIGHMRRNLLIAQTLIASSSCASSLIVAGAREATAFAMPAGVDCLTLPSMSKSETGHYGTRCLRIPLKGLIDLRARTIRAAVEAYEPDAFIVDKVPRGVGGELEPTLRALQAAGQTRCVLGLREVLDEPAAVRREWQQSAGDEAIQEFYDAIWVYGDPAVYDPVREYGFHPEIAAKTRYIGYFDQRVRLQWTDTEGDPLRALALSPGRLVLCMVGGGQDGALLARAFCRSRLPPDTNGVLLTGPFMPAEVRRELRRHAAGRTNLRVLDFVNEPSLLLRRADRVIAMGGYNTVSEVLSFEKPILLVPRVTPRQEQWIRAERLRELGLADVLHPSELTPEALAAWLACDLPPRIAARDRIDFDGLSRLPVLFRELFTPARPQPEAGPCQERVHNAPR